MWCSVVAEHRHRAPVAEPGRAGQRPLQRHLARRVGAGDRRRDEAMGRLGSRRRRRRRRPGASGARRRSGRPTATSTWPTLRRAASGSSTWASSMHRRGPTARHSRARAAARTSVVSAAAAYPSPTSRHLAGSRGRAKGRPNGPVTAISAPIGERGEGPAPGTARLDHDLDDRPVATHGADPVDPERSGGRGVRRRPRPPGSCRDATAPPPRAPPATGDGTRRSPWPRAARP